MITIYALRDPHTSEIRYVGKAKRPSHRIKDHINGARRILIGTKRLRTRKEAWIVSLLRTDSYPSIEVLEIVDDQLANARERFWITQFPNLTNMNKGGDGWGGWNCGKKLGPLSEETRRRVSIGTKKAMNSVAIRKKCSEGAHIMLSKIKDSDGRLRSDIRTKIAEWNKKPLCVLQNGELKEFNSISEFQTACSVDGNRWTRSIKPGLDPEFKLLYIRTK
jgi:hypothetical protein